MKISRQIKKKLSICLSSVLIANTCPALSLNVAGHADTDKSGPSAMLAEAAAYLGTKVNADNSIGDSRLVNDTAYAIAALRIAGETGYEKSVSWLSDQNDSGNTDISARIASALGSSDYLKKMETKQNADYGFGLYPDYSSDVIDSVLVLDALNETGYSGDDISGQDLSRYLLEAANEDGGFAYAASNKSDPLLTAVAVYDIGVFFAGKKYDMSAFSKSVTYISENIADSYEDADIQKTICKHLALNAVGSETDLSDVVGKLQEVQKEDGSFAEDISTTYWAVKLLSAESSKPTQGTAAATTTTSTSTVTTTAKTTTTSGKTTAKTTTTSGKTTAKTTTTSGKTTAKTTTTSGKTTAKTTTTSGKTTAKTTSSITSVSSTASTTTEYTRHKISLTWKELSVEGADIRYQLFRRVNGSDWESYSVWDGNEKINVLNVYPTEPYLEKWMTEPLNGEDTPAGKGLMNIDSVQFSDFNSDPGKYMYDEYGSWKYDVVFFGSADCNGSYDLNEESYAVTSKFAESGRGVLFGRDTVCVTEPCHFENFARFADDLGIVLRDSPTSESQDITTARVVKSGVMTAFPWNVSGDITIPPCHSSGQYNVSGTEWILLDTERRKDSETGGQNSFYLVTKNNFGFIQTGYSTGQITDDERKVLANTLFYLYQNTGNIQMVDNAVLDLDAPEKIRVLDASVSGNTMNINIQAEDKGTVYEYYAKAFLGNNSVKTKIAKETAISGIAGFLIKVTDSEDSAADLIGYEDDGLTIKDIVRAYDGKAELSVTLKNSTEPQFIHIFAVDRENNIKEITTPISANTEEKIKLGDVNFDGKVNAVDASMILSEYAKASTDKSSEFSEKQFTAGDIDENKAINAIDASFVLSYYAYTSTGGELYDMRDWMLLTARSDAEKK